MLFCLLPKGILLCMHTNSWWRKAIVTNNYEMNSKKKNFLLESHSNAFDTTILTKQIIASEFVVLFFGSTLKGQLLIFQNSFTSPVLEQKPIECLQ